MQNQTIDSTLQLSAWPPFLYDSTVFANPKFVDGFRAGVEAYEGKCEDEGRKMTGHEVLADVRDDVAPSARIRRGMAFHDEMFGPVDPRYVAGFLAGELYAHFLMPDPPADTCPDTHPLGVVLPFPSRPHQETLCPE
jgi:hypothetical protein